VILVAGLTPAWQQIFLFDQFQIGEVNRAAQTWQCASGKNLNVAFALNRLVNNNDDEVKVISTAGGGSGLLVKGDFQNEEIRTVWVETKSQTRTCTTILDQSTNVTSELVENSPPLTQDELEGYLACFKTEVKKTSVLVLTGSLPENTPIDYYSRMLKWNSAKAVLDIRGEELKLAMEHRPFLIKPNREELEKTTGEKINSTDQLIQSMKKMNLQGAKWVLISNGSKESWLTSLDETYSFTPPKVQVVNPIGCGDCLTAGIAWGLHQNEENVPKAVQLGMAAAALNLEQILPARVQRNEVISLAEKIVFKEFPV